MSRINTNVSSLVAQSFLARSQADLQTALNRLSTGLQINSGKDDPSGLIASEILRSDIVSVSSALTNTERANQVIATADSALGQVSSLLNDIRGLVTEAANDGALSSSQIAANQLQIDSSLEALNRIAQTTTFQGRRVLDGSLDFVTTAASVATIQDLNVDQANLGATGSITVQTDVTQAAQQATLTVGTSGFSAHTGANSTLRFAPEARLNSFDDTNTDISIRAASPGTTLEGVTVQFVDDTTAVGSEFAEYSSVTDTLTIHINNTAATNAANVVAAINVLPEFTASDDSGATNVIDGSLATDQTVTDLTDADELVITATTNGPDFNHINISVVSSAAVADTSPTAVFDSTARSLILTINDTQDTSLTDLRDAINAQVAQFNATASSGNGDDNVLGNTADSDAASSTGVTGGGTLFADLVVELAGADGSEVFKFGSGASINQIVDAVALVSDATGVTATQSAGLLSVTSTNYGSNAFVQAEVITEGTAGLFENNLSGTRTIGQDVAATVNGTAASADGNTLSINTASLDLSITVAAGVTGAFEFQITGGGALFQIGPDVVSNQQARIGIDSVNTGQLGGVSGRLYQLSTGESASLDTNPTLAASIVDEVIESVASLRGRLGAFQKTTLESNIVSLNDTLVNLTEAESQIRDADFAEETARLTRAQILVQSGTSVLAIANSNPQNVLALLR